MVETAEGSEVRFANTAKAGPSLHGVRARGTVRVGCGRWPGVDDVSLVAQDSLGQAERDQSVLTIYEKLRRGETDIALAQVTQSLKACRQVALDDGEWSVAWELTGIKDHLRPEKFAGSFSEMTGIAAYHKYLRELESSHKLPAGPKISDDEGDGQQRRPRGPKQKDKDKDKEKGAKGDGNK